MTSDSWLETLLKTLVYRGGGVNISGCRGILVGAEANIYCRFFWGCVGMDRPNGAFGEKHIRIRRFLDRINIGLVILFGCDFNEVNGVARYDANYDFGDYCRDPGSI